MELLTKDTHLDFSSDDGATWLELYGLESYPDMGADPPKVKVPARDWLGSACRERLHRMPF